MFRLTTHYPALGLFVIGLAFIVTSVVLAGPPDNRITMTGLLVPPPGSAELDPQDVQLSLESSLKPYFDPSTKSITVDGDPTVMWKVVITYPGMFAQKPVQGLGRKNIVLGNINMVRVAEKPPVNPANIAPMPATMVAAGGGF